MVGALRVDIIDGPSDELAWRGMATAVIHSDTKRKGRFKIIDSVVKEMFSSFPKAKPRPPDRPRP